MADICRASAVTIANRMGTAAPLGIVDPGRTKLNGAVDMGCRICGSLGVAKVTFCTVRIKAGCQGMHPVTARAGRIGCLIGVATAAVKSRAPPAWR